MVLTQLINWIKKKSSRGTYQIAIAILILMGRFFDTNTDVDDWYSYIHLYTKPKLPHLSWHLNWSSPLPFLILSGRVFEWYTIWCDTKNKYKKQLQIQEQIFTLTMNMIFIWAPKIIKKVFTTSIQIRWPISS